MATTTLTTKRSPDVCVGIVNSHSSEFFRFLDLPAELRNLVYEHYFYKEPLFFWQRHRYMAKAWVNLKLTQVCKQIRTESCSTYLIWFPKWVPLHDFDSYLATFHTGNVLVADNIILDIFRLAGKYAVEIDMLPLLKRLSDLPSVVCKFDSTIQVTRGLSLLGLGQVLTRCAMQSCNTTWKVAAAKLHRIVPSWSNNNVGVYVKREYKYKKEARKRFEADLTSHLDLRREGRWKVIIKYE